MYKYLSIGIPLHHVLKLNTDSQRLFVKVPNIRNIYWQHLCIYLYYNQWWYSNCLFHPQNTTFIAFIGHSIIHLLNIHSFIHSFQWHSFIEHSCIPSITGQLFVQFFAGYFHSFIEHAFIHFTGNSLFIHIAVIHSLSTHSFIHWIFIFPSFVGHSFIRWTFIHSFDGHSFIHSFIHVLHSSHSASDRSTRCRSSGREQAVNQR